MLSNAAASRYKRELSSWSRLANASAALVRVHRQIASLATRQVRSLAVVCSELWTKRSCVMLPNQYAHAVAHQFESKPDGLRVYTELR